MMHAHGVVTPVGCVKLWGDLSNDVDLQVSSQLQPLPKHNKDIYVRVY